MTKTISESTGKFLNSLIKIEVEYRIKLINREKELWELFTNSKGTKINIPKVSEL